MSQDVVIPEKFRNAPVAAALAHLSPEQESLTEGIGSSYPVISYAGKRWSLRYKGQKRVITYPSLPGQRLPTDGQPSNYIDVVILRKARTKSKSYYPRNAAGVSFNPDDVDSHKPPLCWSMDSITPDADVAEKQSDTCALCPQNEWKVQPHGQKGRACQDRMRLAVIIMPSMVTPLFGGPILEPMFLPIPPASLQALSAYGDEIEKAGKHFTHVITRIEFLDKTWPQFKYLVADMVSDAQAPAIIKLREDPMAYRITGENLQPFRGNTTVSGQQMQLINPSPPAVGRPLEDAQALERAARIAAIRSSEAQSPPRANPAQGGSPAALAEIEELKAKLAAAQVAAQQPSAAQPPQVLELKANAPQEPAGAPVESTADMDALIASLMPKKPS